MRINLATIEPGQYKHGSLSNMRFSFPLPCLLAMASVSVQAQNSGPAATPVEELPTQVIVAPKIAGSLLNAPLSASVAERDFLDSASVRSVRDAAVQVPNTSFAEFSARKVSSPYSRGVGASPYNPGVITYFDGVPQFNGYSSSLELLDVEQIDFIRGPQGALFGRNATGGMIHVTSQRPDLNAWHGGLESTFGNYNLYDFRGKVTGPLIADQLGFSLAGGYRERDGYTKDGISRTDIDNRSAYFGKMQFLWTPAEELEVRLILAGESAQDGDYGLQPINQQKNSRRQTERSFLGYTARDVIMPTLQVTYHAQNFDFTSTTGYVYWRSTDLTDLDYTSAPFATRYNDESMSSWTQEFRFASPKERPLTLADDLTLSWQAGVFLFHTDYRQQALNRIAFFGSFPQTAELTDQGLGAYAQGTLTWREKLSFTLGLRLDYEEKEANLGFIEGDETFAQVSPQMALSYQFTPDVMAYFSYAGGYRPGGFNTQGVGPFFYDQEQSRNYELGLKGQALKGDLRYNLALFYTDWTDLQLVQPLPGGRFFIDNAGNAISRGVELGLAYDVSRYVSVFANAGWQDAEFLSGARASATALDGNSLPYAPDYTTSFGTQITVPLRKGLEAYARADVQTMGSFNHDAQNQFTEEAYTLANFRLGVRDKNWFAEAYVNNAFGSEYNNLVIPATLAVPGAQPLAENGTPTTFGVRVGVKF
jgi:iron complex outermembrane recepter protein